MPYSERDRIRRFAKVDPLILFGGIYLAFVAGFVNIISLSYFHVPISHMTGAVSKLSIDMASRNFSDFMNISYIVIGFLFGAILSGAIIGARNVRPSIEYSMILFIESASLFISFFLFKSEANTSLFFVAMACGLQNAMASNYLGLIIRTTHVTGIVTDLGVLIGQSLKHRRIRKWKLLFLSSILIGFFAGGSAGFLIFGAMGFYAIFCPVLMCICAAISFYFLRVRIKMSYPSGRFRERHSSGN